MTAHAQEPPMSDSAPLAPTATERRMRASDRRIVVQDRGTLFLVGFLYLALILLASVAMPQPSPVQDRGLRLLEAAGGSAMGACLPGSLRAVFRTTNARVGCALVLAVLFYLVGPWGRIW
jgi:hypothetical protein